MIKEILLFPLKILFYIPIYIYKYLISPLIPHTCRFYPSCSSYFMQSVNEFGVFKGTYLGIKRILRCTPKHKGGLDVPPDNIKGDFKWLI